jgi:hypothetical protein
VLENLKLILWIFLNNNVPGLGEERRMRKPTKRGGAFAEGPKGSRVTILQRTF